MATQPPAANNTAVALFGTQAQLPAHIAQFFADAGTNIAPKQTVPSLSPEGKTWTIALDGQKTKLQRKNRDGDLEPISIMKVVVLDYNKARGRAYYEGEYDPNNVSSPICWSDDGVTPDNSLPTLAPGETPQPGASRKISAQCANCPMSVKGSKVTPQGKAVSACSQHRMLAVIPDPTLGLTKVPPLRLKIAVTSDWDKESPDEEAQGWLSFSRYVDWLSARGCIHTAAIVTKMKFDANAAFPKIFFSAERPLSPEELAVIGPLSKSDDVKKLLGGTWTPAGVDGVPKDQQQTTANLTQQQPAPAVAPVAAAAPVAPATPVTPVVPVTEPQYVMAAGETYTREQYHASGWTDEMLLQHGKMTTITVVAAPPPAPATPPPPSVAPAAVQTMIVEEPVAAGTATAAAVSQPVNEEVIVTPALAATAAPPVQEPAQATAPAPQPIAQTPTPPGAAEAAAAATPNVGVVQPGSDLDSLMKAWG